MKQKDFLKTLVFFCASLFFTNLHAQSAGDIAFVGFNADGDRDFAIVALADIAINSTIYFTDDETDGAGGLVGSEGTITWSTGSNIIKAGTIIIFTDTDSDSNPFFGASYGSITRSGSFTISGSKDGLIAFRGTDENTPTVFLTAVQIGNDSNELGPFDGDGKTLTNTGLNTDSTIIVLDNVASPDGAVYIGSRSNQASFNNYLTELVNEAANWNVLASASDGETLLPFTQESFTTNTTNWTGNTSVAWSLPGNWDNGVPTSSSLVNIPEVGTAPEIDTNTSALAGNLTISDTDGLSVLAGNLTVSGNIIVNAGSSLYLESKFTASKTIDAASVILNGTYSSTDANRFFYFTETFNDNTSGWSLISSPTVGEIIDGGATGFATFNGLQTSATNNYGIAPYDNSQALTTDRWDYYTIAEIAATNNVVMTNGKGYSILPDSPSAAAQNNGNVGFKGAFPTVNVPITLTDGTGTSGNLFNFIGNPYPSFLPFNTTANATNLLTANTGVLDEETIWLWDKATSTYITVNQTTTVGAGANQRASLFISPAQGFFVKATGGGGVFNFTEAMQSHQTTGTFNRGSNNRPEINISVTDNNTSKNTLIYYYDDKTTGFDNGYDSSIFGGVGTSFSLYTQLVSDNAGKNLAIQTLPKDFENLIIPVGLDANAGKEITFTVDAQNLPNGIGVYLEDRLLNTFTRLDETNGNYKLTLANAANGTGRFYMHTSARALSVDSEIINNISVYKLNANTLRIIGLQNGNTSVKVFNILGKQILQESFIANGAKNISLPNVASGVYIFQLQNDEGKLSKKIILE